MDNLDVAILTKLNDLAERHGIKPYDFVACFKSEAGNNGNKYVLKFEIPAQGNALREERFDRMLKDLTIVQGAEAALRGDPATIVDALDNALQIAPRLRLGM